MSRFVYQSTDPEVIATIEGNEAARIEWGNKIRELGKEAFGGEGNFYACGSDTFAAFSRHGEMPEGWRVDRKTSGWVPNRKTAEGKAWQKRLAPLSRKPGDADPGGQAEPFMDSGDGEGMYWRRPNYSVIGGIAYCVWGGEPPDEQIKASIWTHIRYSEFLRVCEDNEIALR